MAHHHTTHRSWSPRRAPLAALVVAPLLLISATPRTARAEDDLDVAELGQKVRQLAPFAIPRTVLIKSIVASMGDRAGFGSGAIISADGYVLTCSHVIDIASRVEVVLSDGTSLPARILGRNKRQDYALLKVEPAEALPYFGFGDSASLTEGQWVVSLGHPGGPYPDLKPAVSLGRITGLHRKLPVQMFNRYYNDAIQTDCPIFAGNSGGPLVDLDGRLLGLNGAILLINDNAYAVPINEILANLDRLKAGEKIAGVRAPPNAFSMMQENFSPEDMQRMYSRMFKNLPKLFGGGDEDGENPLGELMEKLFGGGEPGPNGEPGENPMGKMFERFFGGAPGPEGEGEGEAPGMQGLDELFRQFFGGGEPGPDGEPGENPMGKMLEQLFGGGEPGPDGEPGENPMGKMLERLFGGAPGPGGEGEGEAPGMQGLDELFRQFFGGQPGPDGEPGENPFEDLFRQFFGGQPGPDGAEPAPAPEKDRGGFLGIRPSPDSDSRDLGGILVDEVVPDSPAGRAGLEKGDVVKFIDDEPIPDVASLRRVVGGRAPGDRVTLTIVRARILDTFWVQEEKQIEVVLGSREQ